MPSIMNSLDVSHQVHLPGKLLSTLGAGGAGSLNLVNFFYVSLQVVTSPKQPGTVLAHIGGVLVFHRMLHEQLLACEGHSAVQARHRLAVIVSNVPGQFVLGQFVLDPLLAPHLRLLLKPLLPPFLYPLLAPLLAPLLDSIYFHLLVFLLLGCFCQPHHMDFQLLRRMIQTVNTNDLSLEK